VLGHEDCIAINWPTTAKHMTIAWNYQLFGVIFR